MTSFSVGTFEIDFVPWSRSFHMTLLRKNTRSSFARLLPSTDSSTEAMAPMPLGCSLYLGYRYSTADAETLYYYPDAASIETTQW